MSALRRAMQPRSRLRRHAALALLTLLFALSCTPSEPVTLKSIKLGTGVDDSYGVVSLTRDFAPGDVVYVSIETTGYGSATLSLEWLANDQSVSTETRHFKGGGADRFAFHFAPEGGWPTGTGKVVFWLDPEEKHVAEFAVR